MNLLSVTFITTTALNWNAGNLSKCRALVLKTLLVETIGSNEHNDRLACVSKVCLVRSLSKPLIHSLVLCLQMKVLLPSVRGRHSCALPTHISHISFLLMTSGRTFPCRSTLENHKSWEFLPALIDIWQHHLHNDSKHPRGRCLKGGKHYGFAN